MRCTYLAKRSFYYFFIFFEESLKGLCVMVFRYIHFNCTYFNMLQHKNRKFVSNFSFYINSIFRYFYMYHFIYQFWCVSNRMILHTTCTNYFFPYNYLIFNVNILSLILWITLIWHLLENYCSSIFNFVETGLLLFCYKHLVRPLL